ncbi:MAG: glycoside hydrolase family 2 [Opitutae bacterium]|nr:glycoside hydrolase family 2 [Opitutae bacterium]
MRSPVFLRPLRAAALTPALAAFLLPFLSAKPTDTTETQLLSGSGSDDTVPWEFKVSGGRQAGEWKTIPVPSNWEMQGFGTHRFWSDWQPGAEVPDRTGWYRHRFTVPAAWRSRVVDIVIGAAMTDTEVRLNGQLAGPVHRGGFYEFRYDITPLLRFGEENLLEVTVHKFSADESINKAERKGDYWLFGGIYRPVWLEARPEQRIVRLAVDARHTGELSARVRLAGLRAAARLVGRVETLDGQLVGQPFDAAVSAGQEQAVLSSKFSDVKPWSAETPQRYRLRVALESPGGSLHRVDETIGFRTAELRPGDGFYVNGRKVRLKGTNRHSIWPTSGRTTNRALSVQDIQLIRGMNMNAVRMSHYPPDRHFLEAADELGLYVIDEVAGWQAAYSTETGRPLVEETVRRDANHPSIVMWANGNEGGSNPELVPVYQHEDPQRRLVIHPWQNFNGINTSHYERYDVGPGWFFHGPDVFMPTEFLHGLYDGGNGAGLDDWWNLMLRSPLSAGGFLWSFADEGIVRADEGGRIDVANNAAPDGIVGPYREKEGSYFAVREIWSPVYIEESELPRLAPSFAGRLRVHNRYDFTDLANVRFRWQLVDFPAPMARDGAERVAAEGSIAGPSVAPGSAATLEIPLPAGWGAHHALRLTAIDPRGAEIFTWSWMLADTRTLARQFVAAPAPANARATATEEADRITLAAGDTSVTIDRATGELRSVTRAGRPFSLAGGPRLVSGEARLKSIRSAQEGDSAVVTAEFEGNLQGVTWRLHPSGWLELGYRYHFPPLADQKYLGVSFDYPEKSVTGLRWLGQGPYRVWKNRRKGVAFGLWEKAYNDTMTGLSWEYPEFKGFHARPYWAKLATTEGPITMVVDADDLFLRVFTPAQPTGPERNPYFTRVEFPRGDISFLHGIAAIGTKFDGPEAHGPAGAPNLVPRHGRTYGATIYFRFGE